MKSLDLCQAQEGLWYAQALDPDNPLFNTGQFIELTGPLDLAAFERAHAQAMEEAEALRLRFTVESGKPRQALTAPLPRLEITDLRGAKDGFAAAHARMMQDSNQPTDPAKDPMAAFILFRLRDDHHLWYERIHHLAIDGYGMVLLTNRVGALYGGAADHLGKLAPLAQALDTDAAYRGSDQEATDAQFWRGYCADFGTPASPTVLPTNHRSSHSFLRHQVDVPKEVFARLQTRAKRLRLGWPDVLTLLSGVYLRRVSPDGAAIHGLPFMARFGSKAANVACMWMNVLPYALGLAEDEPLDAGLQREAAFLARMRKSGRYRSEVLRRDLGRTRVEDRLYGPLINVQPFDIAPHFKGLKARLHILSAGPVDDLTISYRGDGAHALTVEIDANPALYDMADVSAHLDRLIAFLDAALDADCLAQVPTVTAAEHAHLIHGLNATDHPLPETSLTALIEDQMRQTPNAPAVIFGAQILTYAALNRRSAALAEHLRAIGAGPGGLVAVALPRSEHLAIALVAILRAGAAYVPLDPTLPPERLAALIGQIAPVVLLAETDIGGFAPPDWPTEPQGHPLPASRPDDLAYVLFTSGSTGAPKGVMIEHRAIVNRLLWMRDYYGFSSADRILQKTPITFDVSVWELFLPYLAGATLVFAPPEAHRDPAALARIIRDDAISVCHFVPSMLTAFLDHPASDGLTMRQVFCSGEALPAALRDRFHTRMSAELHNLYGPTEAAVDVTFWNAGPEDSSTPLPIGFPVWNTRCYVLDPAKRLVPQGVPGELFLGGVQLARGYLNRPDLTEERFLPDPFRPGQRIYATGDLVRQRADGAIVYLGRNDHQVKIRGMRVELGEVEHALTTLPGVREAAVLARDDMGGPPRLVGYVVTDGSVTVADMAAALAARLPAHMVPADLVALPALPTTANGKLDRRALPRPTPKATGGTPAQGKTEHIVAQAFAATLNLPHPPVREADFFSLGGDSLSALRLLLALENALGRAVPLGQLFETPQVAGLAQALDLGIRASAGLNPVFALTNGKAAPMVLLHPAGGLCWGYRALAQAISDQTGCPVTGLQSPVLSGADMPDTLTALCRSYADLIEAESNSETLHLAGWSLGGILAQELAVELTARGRKIGVLALLDAYPAECWRAEPIPDPVTSLRALLAIAGHDPDAHPELDSRAKLVGFLKANSSLLGALPVDVLDAVVRLVTGTNRLMRNHDHRHFNGTLLHIRAAHDHAGRGFTSNLWAPHAAQLMTLDLPCLHKDMVAPTQVDAIAKAIAACL